MTRLRTSELFPFAPMRSPKRSSVGKLSFSKVACIVFVFCVASAMAAPGQTFSTLVNFDGTNGAAPGFSSPVRGFGGNFYGTTIFGGVNNDGTVFQLTPGGELTTLHSFHGADGKYPYGGLLRAADGNLYGTTEMGGAYGTGTVFKVTSGGKLTTLYSFCSLAHCADGAFPSAALVQASNGDFYGTTYEGGAGIIQGGTVFRITAAGGFTTLYSFCSQMNSQGDCTDGEVPWAGLVQAADGDFYGTTNGSGANAHGGGTVFKITAAGRLTTLYSFCAQINGQGDCADGASPYAGLVQTTDGNFYGTTYEGGASNNCFQGCGTVFRITPGGKLTTLHSFNGADGSAPYAGLAQANGTFYGTTSTGGASNDGTIYGITLAGRLTTLHSFDGTDGSLPYAGLAAATNQTFYGTTSAGGANNDGTVFEITARAR